MGVSTLTFVVFPEKKRNHDPIALFGQLAIYLALMLLYDKNYKRYTTNPTN